MTKDFNTLDRDEVLSVFQETCAKPTAEDIISWVKRFPDFADDIRGHAAIALDWAAKVDSSEEPIQEGRMNDAYSQALAGLQAADAESKRLATSDILSFQDCIAACGKTVAMLETEVGGAIGIRRHIIASLFNGAMVPPIGERFKTAIMRALSIHELAAFDRKVEIAMSRPKLGLAKASGPPTRNKRSYEDIVRSSGMTSEQIEYWLGED